MKFLCKLNIHNWNYNSKTERHCKYCHVKEMLIDEGPVTGMADFKYWYRVN